MLRAAQGFELNKSRFWWDWGFLRAHWLYRWRNDERFIYECFIYMVTLPRSKHTHGNARKSQNIHATRFESCCCFFPTFPRYHQCLLSCLCVSLLASLYTPQTKHMRRARNATSHWTSTCDHIDYICHSAPSFPSQVFLGGQDVARAPRIAQPQSATPSGRSICADRRSRWMYIFTTLREVMLCVELQ